MTRRLVLIVLLLALPSWGALSVIQVKTDISSPVNVTRATSFVNSVAAGSFLYAAIRGDSTTTVASVTGCSANSWAKLSGDAQGSRTLETWYVENATAGACTVTVTMSASTSTYQVHLLEIGGTAASSTIDQTATIKKAASGTAVTSNAVTTTVANDILISSVTNGGTTYTWTAPFASASDGTRTASTANLNTAVYIVSATNTYSSALTLGTGGTWLCSLTAVEQAGGAPARRRVVVVE